jgi:hypothetical protein
MSRAIPPSRGEDGIEAEGRFAYMAEREGRKNRSLRRSDRFDEFVGNEFGRPQAGRGARSAEGRGSL